MADVTEASPASQEPRRSLVRVEVNATEAHLRDEIDALRSRLMQAEAQLARARRSLEVHGKDRESLLAEVICAFLPTLDSLELALSGSHEIGFREGLEITYRELVRTLARYGLSVHHPEPGHPFDPHMHEALSVEGGPGEPEGVIAEVLRTGYSLDGRLLRPALVTVSARR
jgi:molecular chaperone GrpE